MEHWEASGIKIFIDGPIIGKLDVGKKLERQDLKVMNFSQFLTVLLGDAGSLPSRRF